MSLSKKKKFVVARQAIGALRI